MSGGASLNAETLNAAENAVNPGVSDVRPADRGSAGIDALVALRDRLADLATLKRYNRLADYRPYPKQLEFHRLGGSYRKRLFSAGNQVGKTTSGAAETAMHATGRYPDWWQGRRFDRPVTWIAGGVSGELVREGPQRLLCGVAGNPEAWGTGLIPRECLLDHSAARGTANLLDSVMVEHVSGKASRILFKAYNQGRAAWQAQTADGVWFDEEPPPDVYSEGVTRTNVAMGPIYLTFTPLQGMSQVAAEFFLNPGADCALVKMALAEAQHYTPEQVAEIIASWPPHERAARGEGTPMLGSGAIFPVPEDRIVVPDFPVPRWWPSIGGLDFGWDHPFAAAQLAYEPDGDVVYVVRCYRVREATPLVHAGALKPWGRHLRWSWPHDGLQHDKGSGEQLAQQYRKLGLKMISERAQFPDGTNGVEAGLSDMLGRMETGRWRVFASCNDWLEEYRTYHRKDGKIVKQGDDAISASRYALMMLRHARPLRDDNEEDGPRIETPAGADEPFSW